MVATDLLSGIDAGVLCGALCLLVAVKVATIIYDVSFSPLSAIPGPWYAAASNLWLSLYAAQFRQCEALHTLFERYGPIVRVGPKSVAFRDWDAMKSVYAVHKLPKSAFYQALVTDNHNHSMTSSTEAEHALRRRTFASHYTPAHITRFQHDIRDRIMHLVEVLDEAPRSSVDCIHLLRHALLDIIRITVFGLPPASVDNWAAQVEDPICAALRDFPMRSVLRAVTPSALWTALAHVHHPRWRVFYNSDQTLASFVRGRLLELKEDVPSSTMSRDSDRPTPLMAQMLSQRQAGSPALLSDQDIVSECMAHLIAGVDTSTATFGFMLWELSQRPDVVQKLRDELDELVPNRRTIPDYATLTKLPYLTAFLNEGFRMYGAVSALLERVVPPRPKGTSTDDDGSFDLMGYSIPPGTVVGMQAWSFHRDPAVFPNPASFDPDRWLPDPGHADDAARLSRMSQHLLQFGAGTRACPGRHQAQIVFRFTIAALVLNFDLSADPAETNAETMAPRDAFAVRPAARECRLTFTPRP